MKESNFRKAGLYLLVACLLGLPLVARAQYTNGIYAEFTTSMGSYTCTLYYATAPKAVANFIGLATGQRSWLDLPTGVAKTNAFYNGTIFHRVIAGFMIQGGSPNGQGTDNQGYAFVDEFSPGLRHNAFGMLSMANSGKDSNGSQYFVTVAATPWLNDVHTIFGRLYGGSNVVYAISRVATNSASKPLTNVVVQNITIRRVGPDATAFNIHAQGLPLVTNLNLKIAKSSPTTVSLTFSNRLYADNRIYTSTNLVNWTAGELGIEVVAPVTNSAPFGGIAPKQFYRAAQIQYPSSTFAPKQIAGRTVTMVFTNGTTGTLVIPFVAGQGSYTYNGQPGTVLGYGWEQDPFNGRIWPIFFTGAIDVDMTLVLNFDTALAGGFSGTIYPPPFYFDPVNPLAYSVSGSFTVSP